MVNVPFIKNANFTSGIKLGLCYCLEQPTYL